jgi:hypothetical protein
MVSQKVVKLCQSSATVTSELAKDPSSTPAHVAKKLYGHTLGTHAAQTHFDGPNTTEEDLELAYQCGRWGPTRPSDLFLKV